MFWNFYQINRISMKFLSNQQNKHFWTLYMQNKPKGLKVTKEDLKADRHDGHKVERQRERLWWILWWLISMMADMRCASWLIDGRCKWWLIGIILREKGFWWQTDRWTDIRNCRVASTTENAGALLCIEHDHLCIPSFFMKSGTKKSTGVQKITENGS